ncbi:MAG: NAD(P)/FAD-dependent oxidoreductase [Acidimicrobiales bacterium]|nr:NAD(P)/FAD-dependent oxidoreductase [Acidimicrobiales bacterium]
MSEHDVDAVVIGAGHNGLVCAAYLARAGMRTLLVEARTSVGGTASSDTFAGATVNICNCDHITFRTTPVMDELRLGDHGLRYLDVDPAQTNMAWSGGPAWAMHHDVDATLDSLATTFPQEVRGYRRYLRAAMPAVQMVFDQANDPPTFARIMRKVIARKGAGVPALLRWSRRSAADVMREFFSTDALQGPAMVTGPMVWGISPELPGTGLGSLTYAMRHVGTVGRPVGGSGMVPVALERALLAHGGQVRLATRVEAITCEGPAVRGVVLDDGTEVRAGVVVSACNPHDTFLRWLRDPPPQAHGLVERWRATPHHEGYESKIDAVITSLPRLRAMAHLPDAAGGPHPLTGTVIVAPSLADMHHGAELMGRGEVLDRPGMFLNVPTVVDPSMAPAGQHVLSLECLYTPYRLRGGWPGSGEPRRWLERLADLAEPGFLDSIGEWRAMTPDRYESEFHLPAGHATSFAGGPLAALLNRQPELTRYHTPVKGLFLTGAATFPGAGVWGASGRNAAHEVLRRR